MILSLDAIRTGINTLDLANDEQEQLKKPIRELASNTRPRSLNMKKEKESFQSSAMALLRGREMVFNAFKSGTCNAFN